MTLVYILAASLIATTALAPIVRNLLLRGGVLDVPNDRSSHQIPVPRGGGIACAAGMMGGFALAGVLRYEVPWLLVAVILLLAGIGYVDDRAELAPTFRLGTQIVAGGLVGLVCGGSGWIVLGALCMPVLVNAVNFMDGINGITCLNIIAWGTVAMVVGSTQGVPVLATIGAATGGSALGFLPWNTPRARIFLGDSGSYLFGAAAASGIALGAQTTSESVVLIAPFAIYLADTGTALIRRAVRGESLMTAHREHVFQRLVNETGLPQFFVALGTVTLALTATAAWALGSVALGAAVTLVVVGGYLASPALLVRAGARDLHQSGGQH